MLGSVLALLSAATFAFTNATTRRGVIGGTVIQGLVITVPIGVPILTLVIVLAGFGDSLFEFSSESILWFMAAGVAHFVVGRYCSFRSTKAIGGNLAGPVTQSGLVITLILAITLLGEQLTPIQVLGIICVVVGPLMALRPPFSRAARTAADDGTAAHKPAFRPAYAEGYIFGLLTAVAFGISPILISFGLKGQGLGSSVSGIFVSYFAASVVIVLVLALVPGIAAHVRATSAESRRWFVYSGIMVAISQLFRYMALAVAPVSVVMPITQVMLIFRLIFSWMLNREHEVFSAALIAGTFISLFGAVALSISTEVMLEYVPLPNALIGIVNWRWP